MNNSLEYNESRREFLLKSSQAVTFLFALNIIPFRQILANNYQNILDTKIGAEEKNIIEGYKNFKVIADINNGEEEIGNFFTMENNGNGKVDFLTNESHPEFFNNGVNFKKIAEQYRNNGNNPAMIMAGAYTPDWKRVEDMALAYGNAVGVFKEAPYRGLLVIKNGKPEIKNLQDIGDFDAFTKKAQNNKWSQFQQMSAIRNGKIDLQSNSNFITQWRFFVERKTKSEVTSGVINIYKKMTLSEAIHVLKKLETSISRIENALLLDTGDVQEAYFYDKTQKDHPMINGQSKDKRNKFTNVLVFYK